MSGEIAYLLYRQVTTSPGATGLNAMSGYILFIHLRRAGPIDGT